MNKLKHALLNNPAAEDLRQAIKDTAPSPESQARLRAAGWFILVPIASLIGLVGLVAWALTHSPK